MMAETIDSAYALHGPVDAPVILLIHGLGLNQKTWNLHIPHLSERYRVLTFDLYGHGDSPPPPETPSLSLFSRQIIRMLDHLEIHSCSMVGFSLGGMINRRFALDFPHRVNALVVLNSPHERSPAAQKLVENRAAETALGGPAATLDSTIERWFTPGFRTCNLEVIAQVRQWVLANDPEIYSRCRQVLATGVVELIRPSPPIEKPALVMTCANDSGSSPEMAFSIAAEIAEAQTLIVPALQHMGLIERPMEFTEPIVRFLDNL